MWSEGTGRRATRGGGRGSKRRAWVRMTAGAVISRRERRQTSLLQKRLLSNQGGVVRGYGQCAICGRCRGRLVVAEELELGQLRRAREPSISLLGSIANSYDPATDLRSLGGVGRQNFHRVVLRE